MPSMTGQAALITVTIKDQSGAGKIAGTITLAGLDASSTLRDLIKTRVREEVARYNARVNAQRSSTDVFHGLVMPDGAKPAPRGFRMPEPRHVDWEQQADKALHAFERNGFFVLVGDRQVTSLDEVLRLTADSDIRFIRLMPLVGG